jgi:colanic acid biosynthesis glycosyl transferase WcaI
LILRILVLGINYWPDLTGIAPFTTGRCEYLAARGHEVTVCTGVPYYPEWRIADGYRGRLWSREQRNGVTILRNWLYVPQQVTSLQRIFHEASFFALSLQRIMFRRRPDLLMVISPPLALGLTGALISRTWRIPYVFHVEDVQPDAAADLGMLANRRILKFLYAIERLSYRRAALVSTLTEAMRRRIAAKGIDDGKVKIFAPWAQPELFAVPSTRKDGLFRRRYGLEGRFIALHSGNIGVKQGLDVVLYAARHTAAQDQIVYLIVGDGAMRGRLEAQAGTMGLSNVRFMNILPSDEYLELLAAADLCLLTQQRTVSDFVFPSKVVSALAAGRPLVASANPDSEVVNVVRQADAGFVVPAEDPAALAQAVGTLCRDEALRASRGAQGRAYAHRHWNRDRILPIMEAQLLEVRGANGPGGGRRATLTAGTVPASSEL